MEIIGLEQKINSRTVAIAMKKLFTDKKILFYEGNWERGFILDDVIFALRDEEEIDYSDLFTLQVEEHPSEFATVVTLYRTPEEHNDDRELYIALHLSKQFNCRAIINCPSDFADHPYCSLIIEEGKIFEADDSGTVWVDGEGGCVKIIQEVHMPYHQFDASGNKIE